MTRRNRSPGSSLPLATVAVTAALAVAAISSSAFASFNSSAASTSNQVSAYTVPVPQSFDCAGIINLLNPRLVWDPVTVPSATPSYEVTDPNGVTTSTSNTFYALKNTLPLLTGTYTLRAQVTAWGWSSDETTKAVTLNGLGLLYVCL